MGYRRVLDLLGLVLFTGLVVLIVSHETLLFKSMPMNGAFQLYNPLQRLAHGEIIGRDFDFFHGSGTLLLHYPLFSTSGGDLFASELSRKIMSPLAFFLCFHFCAAAWRLPAYMASFAGCAVLVLGEVLFQGSGALTGASALGVRSTLPAILLPAVLLLSRRFQFFGKPATFYSFVAIGLGISIFVATEQGLAATGLYGLLILTIPMITKTTLERVGWAAFTGVGAIATFLACTALLSGKYTAESLTFLLADLPQSNSGISAHRRILFRHFPMASGGNRPSSASGCRCSWQATKSSG